MSRLICMIIVVDLIACSRQEAAESINFGRHVSNQLKIIFRSWRRELSIGMYMSRIGGGWVGPGGSKFFGPFLQKFTGSLLRNFKYIIGILSSSPVDWHPFWANWVKGGGLWTCPNVRGTRAWVQAAGWVKPMKQQFTPNSQDCASMR
jgi:hypothetical protein